MAEFIHVKLTAVKCTQHIFAIPAERKQKVF